MHSLIEKIARDIREAGSACDVYMKKGFLGKTPRAPLVTEPLMNSTAKRIKSFKYEGRLAAFGVKFEENRAALDRALTMHTAIGVDTVNQKLDQIILVLFRKLDTPREKDVQKFIDENGGVKACIDKDELLAKLVGKSGESLSPRSGGTGQGGDDLGAMRKTLNRELQEDIDQVLKQNLALFGRKLDIQSDRLDYIISILHSGAHDKILDPVSHFFQNSSDTEVDALT